MFKHLLLYSIRGIVFFFYLFFYDYKFTVRARIIFRYMPDEYFMIIIISPPSTPYKYLSRFFTNIFNGILFF